MKILCDRIQKIILLTGTILFGLITCGSLVCLGVIKLNEYQYQWFFMVFGLFLTWQLILLVRQVFRWINGIDDTRKQAVITGILFLICFLISISVVMFVPARPTTDSFDDLDTAYYVWKNGPVQKDLVHMPLIKAFGNNYMLILFFAQVLKVFFPLIHTSEGMLAFLHIMNVGVLLLATFLTWTFVYLLRGIKAANRVLFLCVINPLYYGILVWIYSLLYSLPIMMGILLVALLLYRSKSKLHIVLLSCILGCLVSAGYECRPTAVFPYIALVFAGTMFLLQRRQVKKILLCGVLSLMVIAATETAMSNVKNYYFAEAKPGNYPIYYWLSMGSHGTGGIGTNQEEEEIVKSKLSTEEKSDLLKQNMIDNYKNNGILGTLRLWNRKMCVTWADGYASLNGRMSYGEIGTDLQDYMGGNHKQIFMLYAQAYRILLCIGFLLFGIKYLRCRQMRIDRFIVLLSVLGGIAFYWIWEMKDIYSAAFLLLWIMLAEEGINEEKIPGLVVLRKNRMTMAAYFMVVIVMCAGWVYISRSVCSFEYMRICSNVNRRIKKTIKQADRIDQTFYSDKPFNEIIVFAQCNKKPSAVSGYSLRITDSKDTVLLSEEIGADDIQDGRITLRFDDISGKNQPFHLSIEKEETEKKNLFFSTKNPYFIDAYRGELYIDSKLQPGDLTMNVVYASTEHFMKPWIVAVFSLIYVFFSIGVVLKNDVSH